MDKKRTLKPFFNWIGSKRRYVKKLAELLPKDYVLDEHTYFEPFLGSGSFLLHLQPKNAIVGDLDQNIVDAFKIIINNSSEVKLLLDRMYKKEDLKKEHIRLCNQFATFDVIERIAAFIFISKHTFGSQVRYKTNGEQIRIHFRSGRRLCDYDNLDAVSEYFKKNEVKIYNQSFEKLLLEARKGDFVFLDPPYIKNRDDKNPNYNFNSSSIESLVNVLLCLHSKGCFVMLINSEGKHLHESLKPYYYSVPFVADETLMRAQTSINCAQRAERIYMNYPNKLYSTE